MKKETIRFSGEAAINVETDSGDIAKKVADIIRTRIEAGRSGGGGAFSTDELIAEVLSKLDGSSCGGSSCGGSSCGGSSCGGSSCGGSSCGGSSCGGSSCGGSSTVTGIRVTFGTRGSDFDKEFPEATPGSSDTGVGGHPKDWETSKYFGRIMKDGTVFNPYIHRRWMPAHYLRMARAHGGNVARGFAQEYGIKYMFDYLIGRDSEILKMEHLSAKRPLAFASRIRFMNLDDLSYIYLGYVDECRRYLHHVLRVEHDKLRAFLEMRAKRGYDGKWYSRGYPALRGIPLFDATVFRGCESSTMRIVRTQQIKELTDPFTDAKLAIRSGHRFGSWRAAYVAFRALPVIELDRDVRANTLHKCDDGTFVNDYSMQLHGNSWIHVTPPAFRDMFLRAGAWHVLHNAVAFGGKALTIDGEMYAGAMAAGRLNSIALDPDKYPWYAIHAMVKASGIV